MFAKYSKILFSEAAIVGGNSLEIRYRKVVWKTILVAEIDSLQALNIIGFNFILISIIDKSSVFIRCNTDKLFYDLDSQLESSFSLIYDRMTSLFPRKYPTSSVFDEAISLYQNELASDLALVKSGIAQQRCFRDNYRNKILFLLESCEGHVSSRRKYINDYLDNELELFSNFFKEVENRPLTSEQKVACVNCTDRLLLVAAAGSGKTSTLIAKIGYLLEKNWIIPSETLILAFNKAAVKEIESRIQSRLKKYDNINEVQSKTFHGYGMEILGKLTGKKPAISSSAENKQERMRLIRTFLQDAISESATYAFSYIILQGKLTRVKDAIIDVIEEVSKNPLQTLQGEIVKSHEERRIADFLFTHGIIYVYEKAYIHDLADEFHRQYYPDFYFPDVDVWYEHFAINNDGVAPVGFDDYLEKTEWRRNVHKKYGTKFFETTSGDFQSNTAYDKILFWLNKYGYDFKIMSKSKIGLGEIEISDPLAEAMDTFIANWKLSTLSQTDLASRIKSPSSWLFEVLPLANYVFLRYETYLKDRSEIDFSDMLNLAVNELTDWQGCLNIKYLLVDEFQDLSASRAGLILAILKNNPECKLFGVGDDWQSINGFAGSEIRLMMAFEKVFGYGRDCQELKLTETFRSNQGITNVSSKFIMKNPLQIRKEISSTEKTKNGTIEIHLFDNEDSLYSIFKGVGDRITSGLLNNINYNVYVLARYNAFLGDGNCSKYESMHIRAMNAAVTPHLKSGKFKPITIHASKGLEANEVMVLGVVDKETNLRSFPSSMPINEFTNLPLPQLEEFEFAEERRLMYVALTRAKSRVTIPVPANRLSRFVIELLNNPAEVSVYYNTKLAECCKYCNNGYLIGSNSNGGVFCTNSACNFGTNAKPANCPHCHEGKIILKSGKFGIFAGCSLYPKCDYSEFGSTPNRNTSQHHPSSKSNYCISCRRYLSDNGNSYCFFDESSLIENPYDSGCNRWTKK